MEPAAIQRLRTEIYSQLKQEFDATIDSLRMELSLRTAAPPVRPKHSLPHPEKFPGSTHKFDTWYAAITAKLRTDGDAIGDATAKAYYVYLNVESQVQAILLPHIKAAESQQSWSYEALLEQLRRVYYNPNKTQEAEERLYNLRQNTSESISVFIAKFERTLYEAEAYNWPDANKISLLRTALTPSIRSRLNQQLSLPKDYTGFLAIVQQLASRISSSSHTPFASTPGNSTSLTPYTRRDNKDNDAMDLNNIQGLPSGLPSIMPRKQTGSRRHPVQWDIDSDSDEDEEQDE